MLNFIVKIINSIFGEALSIFTGLGNLSLVAGSNGNMEIGKLKKGVLPTKNQTVKNQTVKNQTVKERLLKWLI